MQKIEDVLLSRANNNFNLMRLLAAIGVIITHSYALLGLPEKDILTTYTNGLLSFSRLGVYVFFIISGFLITHSFLNNRNIKLFFWKRFLRIFPALFVVLFLCTFVLGPIMTNLPVKDYFKQPGTYHYIIGGLTLYDTQYTLPGVFKSNPRSGINGSLWTLPYEWTCYVLTVCILFIFRKKINLLFLILIIASLILRLIIGRYQILQVIPFLKIDMRQLLLFSVLFFSGSFWLGLRKHLTFRPLVFVIFSIFFFPLSYLSRNLAFYFLLLLLPYLTLSLASANLLPKKITNIFSQVDYSYGLYIYAYPIGQIIVNQTNRAITLPTLALFTLIISAMLAILSWHFVEKPSLRFKFINISKT